MINISKLLKKIIKREADEENQDKTAQNRKDAVKIIQLLPSVSYGDAIGNDVVALRNYLVSKGFHSEIYAKYIDPRMKRTGVNSSTDLPGLQPEDIMLYHFMTIMKTWLKFCVNVNAGRL